MRMKRVQVEWVDSRQPTSGWGRVSEADYPGPCLCRTVGFLVRELPTHLVIVQNIADEDDDPQASGAITIPIECVKELAEI